MEILNSTDIIGDEIKEESRKKAEKILKEADEMIKRLKDEKIEKIAKVKQEQIEIYNNKIEQYRSSVFITLPLEKWKCKVSYIEDTLNNALQKYFDALSLDKKLHIIKLELKKFSKVLSNQHILVTYCGFEKAPMLSLLHCVFPNCNIEDMREASREKMRFLSLFHGLIIEDENHTFICKAGLEQAKEAMLSQIKDSLAKVLFKELLN